MSMPGKPLIAAVAMAALSVLFTGCATTVNNDEVVRKANPVKEMHQELKAKEAAEKSALKWESYEDALVRARKEGKFVMVDFFAVWCKWCKKMDADTYADPRVAEALNADFVVVKVDAESEKTVVHEMRQMSMAELADVYKVGSFPSIWFLDKDGHQAKLLNGYLPPDDFLKYLQYIKGGRYKDMTFEEYVAKGGDGK